MASTNTRTDPRAHATRDSNTPATVDFVPVYTNGAYTGSTVAVERFSLAHRILIEVPAAMKSSVSLQPCQRRARRSVTCPSIPAATNVLRVPSPVAGDESISFRSRTLKTASPRARIISRSPNASRSHSSPSPSRFPLPTDIDELAYEMVRLENLKDQTTHSKNTPESEFKHQLVGADQALPMPGQICKVFASSDGLKLRATCEIECSEVVALVEKGQSVEVLQCVELHNGTIRCEVLLTGAESGAVSGWLSYRSADGFYLLKPTSVEV
eukprot:GEMP01029155.1.p1 GENE.GEMP01029155.1~~GEMP01029155.1.p1  ORF type:complete len:269 (+),score=49.98 GEMP01029155.1:201-1007(+)